MESAVILELVQYRPNNLAGFRLFRHISNGVIEKLPADSKNHPVFGFDLEFWPPVFAQLYPSSITFPSEITYPGAS